MLYFPSKQFPMAFMLLDCLMVKKIAINIFKRKRTLMVINSFYLINRIQIREIIALHFLDQNFFYSISPTRTNSLHYSI